MSLSTSPTPAARLGDEVVLLGRQGDEEIDRPRARRARRHHPLGAALPFRPAPAAPLLPRRPRSRCVALSCAGGCGREVSEAERRRPAGPRRPSSASSPRWAVLPSRSAGARLDAAAALRRARAVAADGAGRRRLDPGRPADRDVHRDGDGAADLHRAAPLQRRELRRARWSRCPWCASWRRSWAG